MGSACSIASPAIERQSLDHHCKETQMTHTRWVVAAYALPLLLCFSFARARAPGPQPFPMSFFVTGVGIGKGGDLGGPEGADAHCQRLAAAVGAGGKIWHAYLSTQARPGQPAINARDRIGQGPWYNSKKL